MSYNNIMPAWALQNPYQLPTDGKWYYMIKDTRFGPFNTRNAARRDMEFHIVPEPSPKSS